jgi:hypothetical protein
MDPVGILFALPAIVLMLGFIVGMIWLSKILLPELWED